jgi:UDP-glucose 4-epimerase
VVAIFCGHLLDGTRPTVFGDGSQTRDWIGVSDVVRANLVAAGTEVNGPVNIAHGQEGSVLELLDTLAEVGDGGRVLEAEFAPERPGEVSRSCLDITRARAELGWQPEGTLPDGLRAILDGLR